MRRTLRCRWHLENQNRIKCMNQNGLSKTYLLLHPSPTQTLSIGRIRSWTQRLRGELDGGVIADCEWGQSVRARDSCIARWTHISGSRTISAIQNPSGSSAERALPHTQASRSIEICVAVVEDHRVREPLRVERKQTVFATWSIIINGVGSRLIVWLSALCFFFVCWRR